MRSIEIVLCSYSADCDAIGWSAIQRSEDTVILVYEAAAQWHDVFGIYADPRVAHALVDMVARSTAVGLALCFAPANVAAYLYTPLALRGAAVGLLSLLRNESGSVGTSLAQTLQERRDQFHSLRLGESLDRFHAETRAFLDQAPGGFCSGPAIRSPRSN